MLLPLTLCLLISSHIAFGDRTIRISNRCADTIWIGQQTNGNKAPLAGGIRKVDSNQNTVINIPSSGWAGRMWPKIGCNSQGEACAFGQSIPPCSQNGCTPPADTKIEFYFPSISDSNKIWYDISLVDGYSLAAKITPNQIVR